MDNIWPAAPAARKASLHVEVDKYFHCGSPHQGRIINGDMPSGKSNCP